MNLGPGPAGVPQLQQLLLRVIGLSVGLAFMALLVMLVIGGIKYLTSGGDQKATASAQKTLTWAVLGMVFFALAWVALLLVKAITGVDITSINLCSPLGC